MKHTVKYKYEDATMRYQLQTQSRPQSHSTVPNLPAAFVSSIENRNATPRHEISISGRDLRPCASLLRECTRSSVDSALRGHDMRRHLELHDCKMLHFLTCLWYVPATDRLAQYIIYQNPSNTDTCVTFGAPGFPLPGDTGGDPNASKSSNGIHPHHILFLCVLSPVH